MSGRMSSRDDDNIIENNQGHGIMAEFACVDVNNCNVFRTPDDIHLELLGEPVWNRAQISTPRHP